MVVLDERGRNANLLLFSARFLRGGVRSRGSRSPSNSGASWVCEPHSRGTEISNWMDRGSRVARADIEGGSEGNPIEADRHALKGRSNDQPVTYMGPVHKDDDEFLRLFCSELIIRYTVPSIRKLTL